MPRPGPGCAHAGRSRSSRSVALLILWGQEAATIGKIVSGEHVPTALARGRESHVKAGAQQIIRTREWMNPVLLGSMSFRVERAPAALGHPAHTPTERRGVVSVEGSVKGGRSPAKRTLYCVRNANTLKGLGLVAAFRGQRPSPSGGEDFPALGGGARGGGARRARQGSPPHRGRFHTKRPKPCCYLHGAHACTHSSFLGRQGVVGITTGRNTRAFPDAEPVGSRLGPAPRLRQCL
jgi:hypothetical protein